MTAVGNNLRSATYDRLIPIVRRLLPPTLHCLTLHRILAAAVLIPLTWSVASTLAVFPHELSYFNEFVGGPLNGDSHLLHANIDWGQGLLDLKRWCDSHPHARPLQLAYFDLLSTGVSGIAIDSVFRFSSASTQAVLSNVPGHFSGWYAMGIHEAGGCTYRQALDRFQPCGLRPVARTGYAIKVFGPIRQTPNDEPIVSQ